MTPADALNKRINELMLELRAAVERFTGDAMALPSKAGMSTAEAVGALTMWLRHRPYCPCSSDQSYFQTKDACTCGLTPVVNALRRP